jgi:hypothetical protein
LVSDYVPNRHLDAYDQADLNDEDEILPMDPRARILAEAQMNRRDKREGRYVRDDGRDGMRRLV